MVKHQIGYVSEFTQFMNEFVAEHPEIVADQYRGRSMYWDKHVDMAEQEEAAQDSVPVDSYYYFGNPGSPSH